ncbi:YtxH-like protein [Metalysinibacillus saudimassiliensis]|uniref:YtxH-like protein n=1 Tax=Metalysinibacillus saudimassiliensis TaxID=1461583 RepID=A0A078M9M4_9BACL|nr:YtxH-like protein [Metalysinibacillus saudimassiliensis]
MKAKNFLLGVTAGVVGGMAVAAFIAPQSGNDLRTTLKSNTTNLKARIAETRDEVNHVKASITTLTSVAKNNIPQIVNELKETIQRFQKEIEPNTTHLQQEIGSLQQSIGEIEKNISELRESTQN